MQTYTGPGRAVQAVAVDASNARIASGGGDRAVFVWDVRRGEPLRLLSGHGARVTAVRFAAPDDALLVSASFDASLRIWDLRSGAPRPVAAWEEARDSVECLAVSEACVLAGSVDGRLRAYDVRMGTLVTDVIGASVTSVDVGMSGDTVLVGALDSKIRLMDRKDGTCLKTYEHADFKNEEYRIRSALGMGDGVVISGSENGEIFVWDLLGGDVIHRLKHKEKRMSEATKEDVVSEVVYCPSRKEWASAGSDGNVVIWTAE